MGVDTRVTRNLLVFRIDTRYNIVFVRGCVPGAKKVGEGRRRKVVGGSVS